MQDLSREHDAFPLLWYLRELRKGKLLADASHGRVRELLLTVALAS